MIASMQRSALRSSCATRQHALGMRVAPRRAVSCAVSAKEFVEELGTIPGKVRVIMVGEGAILESVAPLGKAKYTDMGDKGTLATFSTDDKSFEAHVYLSKLLEAKVAKAKSKVGDYDTYSVRLIGEEGKALLSVFLTGQSPDPAAIKAWQDVHAKFGDTVFFEPDGFGDAMFSFSDA